MKAKFFLILILCTYPFSATILSQIPQIKIPMYFEDAMSNRDTVYVGFDPEAEDDILNSDFGEHIIDEQPWHSDFEVRLGTFAGPFGKLPRMSKTDIQKNRCLDSVTGYGRTFNVLYLKAKHFPIKWTWDSSFFKKDCIYNSFYDRSVTSYLAADIWLKYAQYFRDFKGVTYLTEAYIKNKRKNGFYYDFLDPISGVDSIKSVCFYLLDKKRIAFEFADVRESKLEQLKIYPNPVDNVLNISFDEGILSEQGEIYLNNLFGQTLLSKRLITYSSNYELDVSSLPVGTYFISFKTKDRYFMTKFLKLE